MSGIIYVSGAPRTGKSTFGKQLAESTGARLVQTDTFLGLPHDSIPDAILTSIRGNETGYVVVEGCEVDRLLSRGHYPDVLYWMGGECTEPAMASLAIRSKKAFNAFDGPKYRIRWR